MSRFDVALRRNLIRTFEGGFKRRPVFRYWAELERTQWLPAAAIEAIRVQRLQALLTDAAANSPWYAEQWRRLGFDPGSVQSLADLEQLPVITRDTIREHRLAMRSTASDQALIAKATGGSSGVPLQFDLDHDSNERRMAAWHRGYGWAGAGPGTRQWYIWGVPPASTAGWRKRKVRLYDALYRRTTMSCFDLSAATLDRFVDSLARTRPDAIVAYTGALYTFARMLEEHGIVPFSPGSLVVGAEQLHDFQRELIERVFRAPVYETYGSREFMLIASECEHRNGLHITAEHLIVELLDDAGRPVAPGEIGNVVITDLTNTGMPFIRYANGDRAVAPESGDCACGRGLPLLQSISGRRLDVLVTGEGRHLPGEFFPHILKEIAAVQRFQVIQDVPEMVTVKLVAPAWQESDAIWLRREVAAVAGASFGLQIELVEDIPLTTAGKLRVVINNLAATNGGVAAGNQ